MSEMPGASSTNVGAEPGAPTLAHATENAETGSDRDPSRTRRVDVVDPWNERQREVWRYACIVFAVVFAVAILLLIVVSGVAGPREIPLSPDDGLLYWLMMVAWIGVAGVLVVLLLSNVYGEVDTRRTRSRLGMSGIESQAATVTAVSLVEHGDSGPTWEVQYVYDVGPAMRQGSRGFGEKPSFAVGDPLSVIYDRDHPEVHGWLTPDSTTC